MNQTAAKKNKSKVSATTVLLIALLVIAALILVWTIVENTGIIGRVNTVASAKGGNETFELSENELKVLEYQSSQNISTYLYYYSMYYQYMRSKSFADYYCGEDYYFSDVTTTSNPKTYAQNHIKDFDTKEMAYTTAKTLLVYNAGAAEEGYQFDAAALTEKKKNTPYIAIDTLTSAAEENDVTLRKYIHTMIGEGVSKGDVENVIELYAKSSLFEDAKLEELKGAVTEEEAKEYRDNPENKGYFFFTEYVSCELPSETWVTDDVMESAKECKTLDELKKVLVEAYLNSELTDTVLNTNFTTTKDGNIILLDGVPAKEDGSLDKDKIKADLLASLLYRAELSEDKTVFDEAWDTEKKENKSDVTLAEGYIKNGDSQVTTMYKNVTSTIISLEETDGTENYVDPTSESATDLQKWLFGNEGRKEGDVTVTKVESTDSSSLGESSATTTYTWYRIDDGDRIMIFDTEKTKVGYYVELKDDTAPEDGETETDANGDAKEVLTKDQKYALIEAASGLDARKEVFEDKLSATEQAKLTESALESVGEELAEWFYSADREADNYARITVGEGDDAKEYAVLFVEENDETWMMTAKSALAYERLNEWFDQMAIDCNYKADYEPATETETEAATEATTETATEAATEATTEADTEEVTEAESESAAA